MFKTFVIAGENHEFRANCPHCFLPAMRPWHFITNIINDEITFCCNFREAVSKWNWIESKLRELEINEPELSDLYSKANEIECILIKLYGRTTTESFKKDFDRIEKKYNRQLSLSKKLKYIDLISCTESYCYGCIDSSFDCSQCSFGQTTGKCNNSDSLLNQFRRLLSNLMNKIIDKKMRFVYFFGRE